MIAQKATHTETRCLFIQVRIAVLRSQKKEKNHQSYIRWNEKAAEPVVMPRKEIAALSLGCTLAKLATEMTPFHPFLQSLPAGTHISASFQEISRIFVASIRSDLHPMAYNSEGIRVQGTPFLIASPVIHCINRFEDIFRL